MRRSQDRARGGPERMEREARRSNRAPYARSNLRAAREAHDENVPAERADFLLYFHAPQNIKSYLKKEFSSKFEQNRTSFR